MAIKIKGDSLEYHGNSKPDRIIKAKVLMGESPIKSDFLRVVFSSGIYDIEAKHIKRYARAIKHARDDKNTKVRVTSG
ncbi:hypothetical protein KY320_01580 [Candidatus Woesearchaeota archaeon]|nr:hypothetical protein [Candidatus Woesearchaeota archaeon]